MSVKECGMSVKCSAFGKCGACQRLDVPYEKQLEDKQNRIAELFPEAAEEGKIAPIIGMKDPYHYRNKVIAPYAPNKRSGKFNGKGARGFYSRNNKRGAKNFRSGEISSKGNACSSRILTGMYAPGTHKIIETDECLLENASAKKATLAVRDLMLKWSIPPYDEDTGAGFIRHVVARAGRSGELLVTIVTNGEDFPSSKSFCRELTRRVPEITTVVQNVNLSNTNVVLGKKERTLYGPGFILDDICGLRFRLSSSSFFQVNAEQAEVLYDRAIALADFKEMDTVIDAYCGTGTIGLIASARGASKVIGVDAVEDAIKDARENAKHNGISDAEFICADAENLMLDLANSEKGAGDDIVLMMDPPRSGSTPKFLDAACTLAPRKIVYISCDPTTQKRDVDHLLKCGYSVESVQPVDMFPHTNHIENIILLCR